MSEGGVGSEIPKIAETAKVSSDTKPDIVHKFLNTQNPQASLPEGQLSPEQKVENARWLNEYFQNGGYTYEEEAFQKINNFQKPLVINIGGLFRDTGTEEQTRQEIAQALDIARSFGTVMIITREEDWKKEQQRLQEAGLWRDDMVLLARANFAPAEERRVNAPMHSGEKSRVEVFREKVAAFIAKQRKKGLNLWREDFRYTSAQRIGALFDQEVDVPMITDSNRRNYRNDYRFMGSGKHPIYEISLNDKGGICKFKGRRANGKEQFTELFSAPSRLVTTV